MAVSREIRQIFRQVHMGNVAKNFGLFVVCLTISALLLAPSSRLNIMTLMNPESRQVLATLPFKSENNDFKIVKIKNGSNISVEIYKMKPGSMNSELKSSFQIPNSKDVFYDFKSSLSNLFEANIDEDPETEIIVPVMDHNLVSHLNIIKYEPKSEQFTYHSP